MTKQMKLLLSGILSLLLLMALAMVAMEKEFGSPSPSQTETPVAVQEIPKVAPARTEHRPSSTGNHAAQAQPIADTSGTQENTAVSQSQIDLVTKREEARLRRDEMMKVREETINKLGTGNTINEQSGQ